MRPRFSTGTTAGSSGGLAGSTGQPTRIPSLTIRHFGSCPLLHNDGWVTIVRAGRTFEQIDSIDFGGEAITVSLVASNGTLYVRSYDALYAIKSK